MAPSRSTSRGQVAVSQQPAASMPRSTRVFTAHHNHDHHPHPHPHSNSKRLVPHPNKHVRHSRFSGVSNSQSEMDNSYVASTSSGSNEHSSPPHSNSLQNETNHTSNSFRSTPIDLHPTVLLNESSSSNGPPKPPSEKSSGSSSSGDSLRTCTVADVVHVLGNDGMLPFGYTDSNCVPWATKRYSIGINGLHEELIDLYRYLRPSPLEEQIRKQVFEKVNKVISSKWTDYSVSVSMFGSLRTQLFLPTSDIDVLVECPDWENAPLNETADALRSAEIASEINVLADAFVPIVKMVDKETHISVDISFNTVQSVRAAEYIENVKFEFPVIEPLILILKQFLHQRRLNQTYTGGLSSYGLVLMLIHFLQGYYIQLRRVPITDARINLGELLLRFFEVFSQEFNYKQVGISVREIRYTKKLDDKTLLLSLEDPLLSCNEVGRSTYNYISVIRAFEQAHRILCGILIRKRDESRMDGPTLQLWRQHYSGSMMQHIMPFTQAEVNRRDWLRGFVVSMSYKQDAPKNTATLIYNSFLAEPFDVSKYEWLRQSIPIKEQKNARILPISS